MRAQRQRAGVARIEFFHQLRPQHPRGAKLRDLHEKIHADAEEERKPRGEAIDVEGRGKPGSHILDAVGERIGKLEVGRRARFLHVVAGRSKSMS